MQRFIKKKIFLITTIAALVFATSSIALAEPSCTPLTQNMVNNIQDPLIGITISVPGTYCLQEDLYNGITNFPPYHTHRFFTVQASNVVIDLKGFSIRNFYRQDPSATPVPHDPQSNAAVAVYINGYNDVNIKNGKIEGFLYAIQSKNTDKTKVESIHFLNNLAGIEFVAAKYSRIEKNIFEQANFNIPYVGSYGIDLIGSPYTWIGRNKFKNLTWWGMRFVNSGLATYPDPLPAIGNAYSEIVLNTSCGSSQYSTLYHSGPSPSPFWVINNNFSTQACP